MLAVEVKSISVCLNKASPYVCVQRSTVCVCVQKNTLCAGGYAPRDAVSKPRGSSYSRSVMAIKTVDDTAPATTVQQELPVGISLLPDKLAWDVRSVAVG